MSGLKRALKNILPSEFVGWYVRQKVRREQRQYEAAPVAEVFSEIYDRNKWGGETGEFYSGGGSEGNYAAIYSELLAGLIEKYNIKKVVDLGCGDFRVASQFVSDKFHYTGCDVVPSLIEHLNNTQANGNREFRCLNIIEDELPDGELCLIRQVLQHLSNEEIGRILKNTEKYKYLIITEHFPADGTEIVPNVDIPHGPHVRLHYDSAVMLDQPPFNVPGLETLSDIETEDGTRLKSFLIVRN